VRLRPSTLHPDVRLALRALARFLQDLEAGLVTLQVVAGQQLLADQIHQRHHELAGFHHPVRQRRARQVDAQASEHRLLAVQRQRIDVLRHGDVGQQPGRSQALGDRLWRYRSDLDAGLALRARVLRPDVAQYLDRGGNDLELFGHFVTDGFERVAIESADLFVFGQIVDDFNARQHIRQRPAAALLARVGGDGRFRDFIHRGVVFRTVHRLGFIEQPELVDRNPLTACAEALVLESPDVLFEGADLFGLVFDLRLLLDDDFAQRFDVIGECSGRRRHR
jgi:hypothetical protein